jgi:hypothetical protein
MKRKIILSILIISFLLSGCQNEYNNDTSRSDILEIDYDFENGADGWMGGLAHISHEEALTNGFDINFAHVDHPLNSSYNRGIHLTYRTTDNNMFTYTTKRLGIRDGLSPLTNYHVNMKFDTLSVDNAINSIPMNKLFIKGTVINFQPSIEVKTIGYDNYLFVNPDADVGENINLTTLGNADMLSSDGYKTFEESFDITTNSNGDMWVILGIDSNDLGNSSLLVDNVKLSIIQR